MAEPSLIECADLKPDFDACNNCGVVQAFDHIENLLRAGERDSRLLDGREFDQRRFDEAYALLALLREKASLWATDGGD